ncbi:MAG: glycosyltransferase family 9 protein [bacterium]|nr:glycosyltransferase family 9 protein [bacterium]
MKILIVKTHNLSDILLTGAALKALKAGFPEAHITFLTSEEYAAPARGLPAIDRVARIPVRRLLKNNPIAYVKSLRTVARDKYDIAVLFQRSDRLIKLLKRGGVGRIFAPVLPGEQDERLAGTVNWRPDADRYIAETYAELAIAAGGEDTGEGLSYEVDPTTKSVTELTKLTMGERYAAVYCSPERDIFGNAPLPPPDSDIFVSVIRELAREYGNNVVLMGYGEERKRIESIAERAGAGIVLAGELDRMEAARVIEGSGYVASTDAFALQLAVAFDKPGASIFTASDPRARLPEDTPIKVLAPALDCAPCYANRTFPGCTNRDEFGCVGGGGLR